MNEIKSCKQEKSLQSSMGTAQGAERK